MPLTVLVNPHLKPVSQITDRPKRYRAVRNVKGPKRCALCGSTRDLQVMHLDGNEAHGEAKNLAYGCRSCNQKLSAAFKRIGAGVRTRQYNPSQGVPTFEQYAWAVSQHQKGHYLGSVRGTPRFAEGAHDEGGAIIHATPKSKRIEYAARLARAKSRAAGRRREEVPF